MCEAPVDLSFKCIRSIADVLHKEPNEDLAGFTLTIGSLLSDPSHLAWLDLSFNCISRIDKALTELPELRVLYLHGNHICKLSEVDKLGALTYLHTLTLHGNSAENEKTYRDYVISVLPHLKSMDFSAVTRQERIMSQIWHKKITLGKTTKKS
ncbi:leucine rich repeat containing 51 isoform X2 [Brienomyrus brachyistius]|uniref:leucine rich repeat containing 51 isoform X2 n=1 Tax=Brienomyrus brachyistius TaxID=42636 RepID=UPI0020B2D24A|nr:leucine rich repeat containing 51 isoform X2 [Brienomyrus brachyistius]XP_048838221.1 leucine rich repeat containing 51 isoform X2 [Brienomyrus brachyistius]